MINLFWAISQHIFHNAIALPELNFFFKTKYKCINNFPYHIVELFYD